MSIVLAYGTLKQGYGLHSILKYSDYLGEGVTSEKYTLLKGPHFPFLVKREGMGAKGELYEVTDDVLMDLDIAEGHPTFYRREFIDVKDENQQDLRVYAYIHPDNVYVDYLQPVFEWEA
ncbi:MAG: hypothetical protein COB41_00045 [Proteobacteria bacterium]|nr:MAG: hypothetical protein COB41_00045 [Pseudomonadota bacterium]